MDPRQVSMLNLESGLRGCCLLMQASSGILHFVEVFDSVVGELKAFAKRAPSPVATEGLLGCRDLRLHFRKSTALNRCDGFVGCWVEDSKLIRGVFGRPLGVRHWIKVATICWKLRHTQYGIGIIVGSDSQLVLSLSKF
jgi:hypothetical protein